MLISNTNSKCNVSIVLYYY